MMDPGHIDREGRRLVGPTDLTGALAQAEEHCGMRMAVSCPNGDYVAVQLRSEIVIRRLNRMSGRAGSVMDSGEWLQTTCINAWRPA